MSNNESQPQPTQPGQDSWSVGDYSPIDWNDPTAYGKKKDKAPKQFSKQVRFSTIVWGLIIAIVGASLFARALGYSFDTQLAGILVLGVSGLLLVASAIVRTVRKSNSAPK